MGCLSCMEAMQTNVQTIWRQFDHGGTTIVPNEGPESTNRATIEPKREKATGSRGEPCARTIEP